MPVIDSEFAAAPDALQMIGNRLELTLLALNKSRGQRGTESMVCPERHIFRNLQLAEVQLQSLLIDVQSQLGHAPELDNLEDGLFDLIERLEKLIRKGR